MSATFYLCASHHAGNRAGQTLLREIAAGLPRAFRACHVGVFHGDDRRFAQKTTDFLSALGARVDSPRLSDRKVDTTAARDAIANCDLLYLDGGDTVEGVTRIRELGLGDAFRLAAQRARAIFGLSGGACAAAPCTIGYDDDDVPYVAECLAIGSPLPLDVHDEREDWPEMRALLGLLPRAARGIVVPSHGVLVVSPTGEVASHGSPGCERRSLTADGAWHIEAV